jgi:hypothetical protein
MVIITRDIQDEDLTLPRSQSFRQLPGLADEEQTALSTRSMRPQARRQN